MNARQTIAYRKRQFDDIERLKKEKEKYPQKYLKRSSITIEDMRFNSLKSELLTYKKLLLSEQKENERLLCELSRERTRANQYAIFINKIKTQLEII